MTKTRARAIEILAICASTPDTYTDTVARAGSPAQRMAARAFNATWDPLRYNGREADYAEAEARLQNGEI